MVYSGTKKLTDSIGGVPIDAGKLVYHQLEPMPQLLKILEKHHGNSRYGSLQWRSTKTKMLHFVENVHVIKDNLFDIPPLFKLIQEESGTDWKEMYKSI